MDLVKSYDDSDMDSTDSDIAEVKEVSVPQKPAEVDVINLDSDTETEEETVVEKEKFVENKEKTIDSPNRDIEEITLEDSPVKKPRNLNSASTEIGSQINKESVDLSGTTEKDSAAKITSTTQSNQPPIAAKKIDYLNLEDTESETECDNNENNITTLMDTASVLNDAPCGPEKPTGVISNVADITKENVSLSNQFTKNKTSNLRTRTDSTSSRNTPDVQNNISHDSAENSLLDTFDKESTEAFPLINNSNSATLSLIFREDNRVIEASQKIITCRIPRQVIQTHNAHTKLITSLSWCIPKFSYLFLSASHDGSLKIWDLFRTNSVQCIKAGSGLNAAKWSLDGGQIVAGGLEKKAFVYDVQTGARIIQYDVYNIVTSMECHPYMEDVFLVGTKNAVLGFDVRVDTPYPIRSYFSQCEEVLDIAFLDENEFVCSTNIVSHDSSDRTIMAWDFASGALLSNQIYMELFTCPSLKVHPSDSSFIAQTNGNYIAAFSTNRPYKMKDKRYTGHKVAGHGIECDISPDGKYAVSGDVDGSLYFYNYSTTSTVLATPKRKVPTNRVKWHPVLSSTLICSTYDGLIQIWK